MRPKPEQRRPNLLVRLWRLLRGGHLSPQRAGLSMAVGLFIGCQPLYGLHLVLCMALCLPFRLDLVLAYLAANISNPLVAPFLLMLELEVGAFLLHGTPIAFDLERAKSAGAVGLAHQTLLGAQVVGLALAMVGGVVAYGLVRSFRRRPMPAPEQALSRTIDRFSAAVLADRTYVAMKLRMDPLTEQLLALSEPLGRVLDVGCGRGQFSLLLLELGLVESVRGFDWDARKVSTAQTGANGDAKFEVADAGQQELPACDTLLLIDVLHYLPIAEQDALLIQVSKSIAPGGRLLLRDMDGVSGWASALGKLFERIAARTGYNRARKLSFRPMTEVVDELRAMGFSCRVQASRRTLWSAANVFVIAVHEIGGPSIAGEPRASELAALQPSEANGV